MLKTIGRLAAATVRNKEGITRYDYGTISDFLECHRLKEDEVYNIILQDIVSEAKLTPSSNGENRAYP